MTKVEFDADGLVARVAKASVDVLRRMGAYVRRVARHKVHASERPSHTVACGGRHPRSAS